MAGERSTFPSAVHVFLLRGKDVLLLRRFNTGYEDGNYSVVAGHLDGGETVKTAAIREAQEEVGVTLTHDSLSIVGVMHRLSNDERIDWFLIAQSWIGSIRNGEPDKCDDLRWLPLDALPANTIPYVQRALYNYQRGILFDSFGWHPDE